MGCAWFGSLPGTAHEPFRRQYLLRAVDAGERSCVILLTEHAERRITAKPIVELIATAEVGRPVYLRQIGVSGNRVRKKPFFEHAASVAANVPAGAEFDRLFGRLRIR